MRESFENFQRVCRHRWPRRTFPPPRPAFFLPFCLLRSLACAAVWSFVLAAHSPNPHKHRVTFTYRHRRSAKRTTELQAHTKNFDLPHSLVLFSRSFSCLLQWMLRQTVPVGVLVFGPDWTGKQDHLPYISHKTKQARKPAAQSEKYHWVEKLGWGSCTLHSHARGKHADKTAHGFFVSERTQSI